MLLLLLLFSDDTDAAQEVGTLCSRVRSDPVGSRVRLPLSQLRQRQARNQEHLRGLQELPFPQPGIYVHIY